MSARTDRARKRAPGPWTIEFKAAGRNVIKDADGYSLVVIDDWTPDVAMHMIAAAPDLLATLERLVEKTKLLNSIQHTGGELDAEGWSELYALTNEADAAITKAKGGAA